MSHSEDVDYLPVFRSPLLTEDDVGKEIVLTKSAQSDPRPSYKDEEADEDFAIFKRLTETTNSELFYDLFFVANLTVFTTVHEVNDSVTFRQYLGFFAILWLTWYQVSLYDVRYSGDSVMDRIAKALQFGVMVGFAVVGPNFDVGSQPEAHPPEGGLASSWYEYRALSLILMASRFVLVVQYLQVLLYTRRIKSTRIPFLSIITVYFVAGCLYLGVYFIFAEDRPTTYIAWYIIAVVEAIIVTGISTIWRNVSFKGTHLVQRMSLLTLIFFGEGVIGAARQVQTIFNLDTFSTSAVVIGNVISIVLILYFLYMMYFDWIEESHFGTIREQVWAFVHFPLHLALVVAVEGIAQTLAWTTATDTASTLYNLFDSLPTNATEAQLDAYVGTIQDYAQIIQADYFGKITFDDYDNYLQANTTISNNFGTVLSANSTLNDTVEALENIYVILNSMVYSIAGFLPEGGNLTAANGSSSSLDAQLDASIDAYYEQFRIYKLTFVYTFVSIGLVVILIGAVAWLSKVCKSRMHWARLSTTFVIGVGICLVALVATAANPESDDLTAYDYYTGSPWILPTLVLALFLAVVLNNVKVPFLRRHSRGRSEARRRGEHDQSPADS